jgi:hypothetical protein
MVSIIVKRVFGKLIINEWQFRLDDFQFFLSSFDVYERATVRHKFVVTKNYFSGSSNVSNIEEEDVPLPEDVKAEAVQQLLTKLKIGKKSELYGK